MVQVGRLAMRHEGEYWKAYYALPANESGVKKIFLGCVRMIAVVENEGRREAFIQMMRDIVSDIIEEQTGIRPTWGGETPGPEHERAGHA